MEARRGGGVRIEVSSADLDLFGDGRRVSLADLSPGMTLIYGPNESGKSTTRQLIAGGIFPYPKARSNARVQPPTMAKGRIRLSLGGKSVTVGTSELDDRGGTPEEQVAFAELAELRASVDQGLYRRLFCISYEDLLTSSDLVDDEIVNHLTGLTSAGEAASSVREALKKLEDLRSQIYRPRARARGTLNALIAREAELARALRLARREIGGIDAREKTLGDLEAAVKRQEATLRELDEQASDLLALRRYSDQEKALPERLGHFSPLRSQILALPETDLSRTLATVKMILTQYNGLTEYGDAHRDLVLELKRRQQSLPSSEVRARVVALASPPTLLTRWERLQELVNELSATASALAQAKLDAGAAVAGIDSFKMQSLSDDVVERGKLCDDEVLDALRLLRGAEADIRGSTDREMGESANHSDHREESGSLEQARHDVEAKLALGQSFLNAVEGARLVTARTGERHDRDATALGVRRGIVVVGVALLVIAMTASGLLRTQFVFALVLLFAVVGGVLGLSVIWRAVSERRRSTGQSGRLLGDSEVGDASRSVRELGAKLDLKDAFDPSSEVLVRASLAELSKVRDEITAQQENNKAREMHRVHLSDQYRAAHRGVEEAKSRRIELLRSLGIDLDDVSSARIVLETLRKVSDLERQHHHLTQRVRDAREALERTQREARDLVRERPGSATISLDVLGVPGLASELDSWIRSMDATTATIDILSQQIVDHESELARFEETLSRLWPQVEGSLEPVSIERSQVQARDLASELDGELSFRDRYRASKAVLEPERQRLSEVFSPDLFLWARDCSADEFEARLNELSSASVATKIAIDEARSEVEKVRAGLESLERTSLVQLESEYLSVCDELKALTLDYLCMTSAASLLKSAHIKYELEAQPRVLARAGELFQSFTAGRYRGIVLTAEREFEVEGLASSTMPSGRKRVTELSLGTRNQLIFALRLAYLEVILSPHYILPMIVDDVAVSTDEGRLEAILWTLMDLAQTRQILYLTCHERERDHVLALQRRFPELPCSVLEIAHT